MELTKEQQNRLDADRRAQPRGWEPSGAYLNALQMNVLPGMKSERDHFYEVLDSLTGDSDADTVKLLRIKHVLEHYHEGDFATTSRDYGKGMAFIVGLIEKAERGEEIG